MAGMTDVSLTDTVRNAAHPLTGVVPDYDPLIGWAGDARFALLGEASHRTHEFYRERAEITKRLITERGFTAVVAEGCRDEVINVLLDLQRRAAAYAQRDGRVAQDEFFDAEQNARLVRNAEAYYRSMFLSDVSSWNLRDRHMVETLDALVAYLERRDGRPAKVVVVWANNSHLGDARATEMGQRRELNVGQLVRQRHGSGALLVGFSTHRGTVTAASNWDGHAERKRVRPALAGSYEATFHDTHVTRFLLRCRDGEAAEALSVTSLAHVDGSKSRKVDTAMTDALGGHALLRQSVQARARRSYASSHRCRSRLSAGTEAARADQNRSSEIGRSSDSSGTDGSQ